MMSPQPSGRRARWLLASTIFSVLGAAAAIVLLSSSARRPADAANSENGCRAIEVRFAGGENSLAGTLVLPTAAGPYPAVVLVNPAGPSDRSFGGAFPALGRHLARHGIASLSWDRPGVGQSSGDFDAQGLTERKDEVLSALRFLNGRSEIQRNRVGLAGLGQGGVIAPVMAADGATLAFVINVSGSPLVVGDQELYRIQNELRADGFASKSIEQAKILTQLKVDLLRGAGLYEEFDAAQKGFIGRPWFEYLHYCERKRFDAAKTMVDLDPGAAWEKVRCPVLAVFGAKDATCPVEESVTVLRDRLKKAGNSDATVKVLPDADHNLAVSNTGGRREARERAQARPAGQGPEFAPAYFDTLSAWLAARFGPRG
jgi:pimeloyl-ACP methyl ester carboxylesterase